MNLSANILMWFSSILTPLNLTGQYNTASNSAAKAVIEEPVFKQPLSEWSSNIDKLAWQLSPITQKQAAYIAAPYVIIKPFYDRHLNTSQFGELKVNVIYEFTLSPQVDYCWKDQETINSMLVLKRNF